MGLDFFFPEDFVSVSFMSYIISRLAREAKLSVCCSFDYFFFFLKRNSLLPSKGIDMADRASKGGSLFSFLFFTSLLGTFVEVEKTSASIWQS